MAKMVKMCDLDVEIAVKVFQLLNPGKIRVETKRSSIGGIDVIVTTVEPKELVYPEGWYYAKGCFTNKHNSTTGNYYGTLMYNAKTDRVWDCPYCTAD